MCQDCMLLKKLPLKAVFNIFSVQAVQVEILYEHKKAACKRNWLCIKSCLKNILIRAAVLCLIPWEFFLTITLYFSVFSPKTACQNSSHKNCLGTSAQVPALSAYLAMIVKLPVQAALFCSNLFSIKKLHEQKLTVFTGTFILNRHSW